MTLVVDASTVVAALVDAGPTGEWARQIIGRGSLAAPHLLPAEVTNFLRRVERARSISPDAALLAHAELGELGVELYGYPPIAQRVWSLRKNLTTYDAWYVALAEALAAPLATLDRRLRRAPGVVCDLVIPPAVR